MTVIIGYIKKIRKANKTYFTLKSDFCCCTKEDMYFLRFVLGCLEKYECSTVFFIETY